MYKICFHCEKTFQTFRKNAKYCSMHCYNPILKITKKCKICNIEFIIANVRKNSAKYCSRNCLGIDYKERMKGKNNPFYGKTHINLWFKGKEFPERQGKNHFAWKGNKVKYGGLHDWIKSRLGKANHCENFLCRYPRKNYHNKIMIKPKRYEWANKSGKYFRDLSDWIQLCVSCHHKFDLLRQREM